MTYLEFVGQLQEELRAVLPEGTILDREELVKNNAVRRDGLVIRETDGAIAPVLYLEDTYTKFCGGEGMNSLVKDICAWYDRARQGCSLSPDVLTSWEKMRRYSVCRVISAGRNEELLEKVPHRRYLDLAIVFYCMMDAAEDTAASVLIRHEQLQMWGIDQDKLEQACWENMHRDHPSRYMSLSRMMNELTGVSLPDREGDVTLHILTNREKNYGAVWMTDEKVLASIAQRIGSDYYVLPSSVHEVMIVPDSIQTEPSKLADMVREINESHVPPEDILEDTVYRYDAQRGCLEIAAK